MLDTSLVAFDQVLKIQRVQAGSSGSLSLHIILKARSRSSAVAREHITVPCMGQLIQLEQLRTTDHPPISSRQRRLIISAMLPLPS
jgi:hypothetical protein